MADTKAKAVKGAFANMIARSGDAVVADRGDRVTKQARLAYDDVRRRLENKVLNLEDRRAILLDQSPDNRFSLKVGQEFDAKSWVDEYQRLSVDIETTKQELDIAEENFKALFG